MRNQVQPPTVWNIIYISLIHPFSSVFVFAHSHSLTAPLTRAPIVHLLLAGYQRVRSNLWPCNHAAKLTRSAPSLWHNHSAACLLRASTAIMTVLRCLFGYLLPYFSFINNTANCPSSWCCRPFFSCSVAILQWIYCSYVCVHLQREIVQVPWKWICA